MEGPEAAEERAHGDDAAEGRAGGACAGKVGRVVEVEEDLLQELVGEGRQRRHGGDDDPAGVGSHRRFLV